MTPPVPGRETKAARLSLPIPEAGTTLARLGEVRPQPVSSWCRLEPIHPEGEEQDPEPPEDQEGGVPQDDILGGPPLARLEGEGIAQDGHHEGRYGHLEPQGGVAGGPGLLEGPQAVGGYGDRRSQRADIAQEPERVGPEGRPVRPPADAQLLVLGRPLAGHHEERAERGDDEEPVRQGNPYG